MVSIIRKQKKTQRTVKAFEDDIALINEQAKRSGCSASDVIHQMCETLQKQVYLQELGESFDLMRTNAEQLADFQAEQEIWDCTLTDGLDNAS